MRRLAILILSVLFIGCNDPLVVEVPDWPDGKYEGEDTDGDPQFAHIYGLEVASLSLNAEPGTGTTLHDISISGGWFNGSGGILMYAEASGEWTGELWECSYRIVTSSETFEDTFYLEPEVRSGCDRP